MFASLVQMHLRLVYVSNCSIILIDHMTKIGAQPAIQAVRT